MRNELIETLARDGIDGGVLALLGTRHAAVSMNSGSSRQPTGLLYNGGGRPGATKLSEPSSATETNDTLARPVTRSAGAERMRRHRERRRDGKVCCMVELDPPMISALIELGWLRPKQREDRAAVEDSFFRFIGNALDVTRHSRR